MKDKIILDLCGGTGAWSKFYREAGYTVYIITLPEWDVTKYYFTKTHLVFFMADKTLEIPINKIYGILAAPPCTEFSIAKGGKKRDFKKGMNIVISCLGIIWKCRYNHKIKFWALENPRGFLRQFLGKPPFTFEQWQFGDKGIKPTDLWGYYCQPKITIKNKPTNLTHKFPNGKVNSVEWSKSAKARAITPAGFAKAFYEVNK